MKSPRVSRRKEILKIRAEINAKEIKDSFKKSCQKKNNNKVGAVFFNNDNIIKNKERL